MWKKLNLIILSCVVALGLHIGAYAEDDYDYGYEDDYIEEEIYQEDDNANQDK